MHPIEQKIFNLCRNENLLNPGDSVVVGVSGGVDSAALLHVLHKLSSELGVSLVIAHVNHGLRPEESSREQKLVESFASKLGLTMHSTSFDVRSLAQKDGLSVEEAARNVRYTFFEKVMKEVHAQKICVAHHGDDQAEELLIRLLRGTGRKGLSGMELIRDGFIVRPFLAVTKDLILQYVSDCSIPYLEDSSNISKKFLRNRIRHELLPELRTYNPNIDETLRRTADILTDEESVLEELSQSAYEKSVTVISSSPNGLPKATIHRQSFSLLPMAIKRRVLEKVFTHMKAKPSYISIDDVIGVFSKAEGTLVHLAMGLRALRNRENVDFSYPKGMTSQRGDLVDEPSEFRVVVDKTGTFFIKEISAQISVELLKEIPGPDDMRKGDAEYFDHKALPFPFTIRSRQPGDALLPLGASGTKKIGRILTDKKISTVLRKELAVIVSEDGQIAGVPGVVISQKYRVKETTRAVLKIKKRPHLEKDTETT